MWGVVPSPIFEPYVSEQDFENWLEGMFDTLDGDKGIICKNSPTKLNQPIKIT